MISERGRKPERERESERERERERSIGCLPFMPELGIDSET